LGSFVLPLLSHLITTLPSWGKLTNGKVLCFGHGWWAYVPEKGILDMERNKEKYKFTFKLSFWKYI